MYNHMFERDLLYPTDNPLEPGSVHVSVLSPDIDGRLPVLISSKSEHNPIDYIDDVVEVIQADIFDRIRIDIRDLGVLFIHKSEEEYTKIIYENGKPVIG
ncbi:MAG: hypothetical protein GX283_07230 [Clostridiaceae bacterium]|jgi:hypothetical protein|nr:hypothetical protein [Clostridiaceae bacterium]